MVKKNLIIFYLLIIFSMIGCDKKPKIRYSYKYFGFENLSDSYNSKTQIFVRKYSDDTIYVRILLTKDEENSIIKSFKDNDFEYFPQEIDCTTWGVLPKIYNKLFLDNNEVILILNSGSGSWFCLKEKKFVNINSVLQNIILEKPEVKKLAPSDIYYE